jgi:hypothetical protein
LRTPEKAIIALVVAFLMMLPLAGSALAKPILVDSFDAKMDSIQNAIDRAPRAAGEETRDNHGWYVSQLATDFNDIMDSARVGSEDLSRGYWISMFSRWLKQGGELSAALKAKAEAQASKRAAAEEKKQNRVEATAQDDEDDEDGGGRSAAPGQVKKMSAGSAADDRRSNSETRARGNPQGSSDDTEEDIDDGDGLGRENAPGQLKKASTSSSGGENPELNRGLAKKAAS